MGGLKGTITKNITMQHPLLHTVVAFRRTRLNRLFTISYMITIFALLYHHLLNLANSTNVFSLSMFLVDLVLAFMWTTAQAFRMSPVRHEIFPEHLANTMRESDFLALDVFICTMDPLKEQPMTVVNMALSVMAYENPTEKLSVHILDDGGS
ncbi:unnamed protein product, partial [Ilex paraguariensis]